MLQVLKKAAERKELVQVALNTHGTRAVQKLIETLTSREQVWCFEIQALVHEGWSGSRFTQLKDEPADG